MTPLRLETRSYHDRLTICQRGTGGGNHRLIRRWRGWGMAGFDDLWSEDTKAWLWLLRQRKLHPSYYKILGVLREGNTSPAQVALHTGLDAARVRARLKAMAEYGYVEVIETLSDRTAIWGLVETFRKPDVPTYPTEATIAARRSRQSEDAPAEFVPVLEPLWGKQGKPKTKDFDLSSLKKYEAT